MDMLGIVALVSMVDENRLLKNMENQKNRQAAQPSLRWRDISLFYLFDDFGKYFKKNYAQNDSGREPMMRCNLFFSFTARRPPE